MDKTKLKQPTNPNKQTMNMTSQGFLQDYDHRRGLNSKFKPGLWTILGLPENF